MTWPLAVGILYALGAVLSWRATVRWVNQTDDLTIGDIAYLALFATIWPVLTIVIYRIARPETKTYTRIRNFLLAAAGVRKEHR